MGLSSWWAAIVAETDDIQVKPGYWVGAAAVCLGSASAGGLRSDPAPDLALCLFAPFLILSSASLVSEYPLHHAR